MNKLWFFYIVLFFSVTCCQSPEPQASCNTLQGKVLEGLSLSSKVMGKGVHYSVYLPPDYDASQRSYPVLYLLHGYTDDEKAWVQFGQVNQAADEGIANGEVPPMIIVMPDGGVTFFIDDYKGKEKYETMFMEELMPAIESQYRVRKQKEFRAVAGLSMGGYGATVWAMHHPDLFAACVAFSSAFRSDEEMATMSARAYGRVFDKLYGENLEGKDRITTHWHQNSPLYLARTLPAKVLKSVRWYFDCGDEDFLSEGNARMHITLFNRKIPHEFRVRNGTHSWKYWRTGIKDGLRFIAESFHR